jgi:uncharacterized DUF497 family protein
MPDLSFDPAKSARNAVLRGLPFDLVRDVVSLRKANRREVKRYEAARAREVGTSGQADLQS